MQPAHPKQRLMAHSAETARVVTFCVSSDSIHAEMSPIRSSGGRLISQEVEQTRSSHSDDPLWVGAEETYVHT